MLPKFYLQIKYQKVESMIGFDSFILMGFRKIVTE